MKIDKDELIKELDREMDVASARIITPVKENQYHWGGVVHGLRMARNVVKAAKGTEDELVYLPVGPWHLHGPSRECNGRTYSCTWMDDLSYAYAFSRQWPADIYFGLDKRIARLENQFKEARAKESSPKIEWVDYSASSTAFVNHGGKWYWLKAYDESWDIYRLAPSGCWPEVATGWKVAHTRAESQVDAERIFRIMVKGQ